jgi:hypothetical protein
MKMRRSVLDAIVAMLAIGLGVVSVLRGQVWLGVCFAAIGVLRILLKLPRWITPKPPEEIRLNLEGDEDRHSH